VIRVWYRGLQKISSTVTRKFFGLFIICNANAEANIPVSVSQTHVVDLLKFRDCGTNKFNEMLRDHGVESDVRDKRHPCGNSIVKRPLKR
jgi:hypothetical protein